MKQQLSSAVNPAPANQPFPVSSTFYFLILLVGTVSNVLVSAKWGIAGFAWIAPVCFLFFYRYAPMKRKFLWLFLGFSISSIVSSYDVAPFPIPVLIILGIVEALKTSLIYIVDKIVRKKSRLFVSTLFFPAAFVVLEYINTKIGGGIWWSIANSIFISADDSTRVADGDVGNQFYDLLVCIRCDLDFGIGICWPCL